ncbi:MAG: Asp-tRNA(Asn)/Glu-tRNA(Gln) amidotransferase subunit GatA [Leptospiraceae bacterium]|nr:Asp-tRNA(Asn)/Glu-tRNA(Gln) amidotransferase subunit GatA [Leptospiraceae bacterium]
MIFEKYQTIKKLLNEGKLTSSEICKSYLQRIKEVDSKVRAFLFLSEDYILNQAEESDKRRKEGRALSEWDGIPIGIKDNICVRGVRTSCASKILENFISPYNATVIQKLLDKGFVLFPGLNMDEFAMGSSTENSAFQITRNPFDLEKIPGGSSGGSAAAIASSMLPIALGSDTGGSIRQPASLCGIYGLKPTYGTVSRFGLVAYASSLDQIGPMSNDIHGIIDIYKLIRGKDVNDSTSVTVSDLKVPENFGLKGLKIGIMKDEGAEWEKDVYERFLQIIEELKKQGAIIYELDFSLFKYSIPVYYIIATAECSSNLSRFDGIRYGLRVDKTGRLEDLYIESRSAGFGKEVKRRILLGTFSLSSGYYDAYYGKAQKARAAIRKKYEEFFSQVDFILQPTSPTTAFKIGEKTQDPVQMYKADIMNSSVNLAGLPAMSIPAGCDKKGLPIGLQITAKAFHEAQLFKFSEILSEWNFMKVELPITI